MTADPDLRQQLHQAARTLFELAAMGDDVRHQLLKMGPVDPAVVIGAAHAAGQAALLDQLGENLVELAKLLSAEAAP